jgi:hypothetical protein
MHTSTCASCCQTQRRCGSRAVVAASTGTARQPPSVPAAAAGLQVVRVASSLCLPLVKMQAADQAVQDCYVGAKGGPAIEPVTAVPNGGAASADASWVPPETFERKSTKFWAHPAVIPALQVCHAMACTTLSPDPVLA